MANAPNPRGGSRRWLHLRAHRFADVARIVARASLAIALVLVAAIARAEDIGQWRPRKPAHNASAWSPDAAGRLPGDFQPAGAPRWLPSRPVRPLARPAVTSAGKPANKSQPVGPQLPRYAAFRAEIEDINTKFADAVESQADQRQFDVILVRAYRVRDDAQTPSERALADDLLKRVGQYNVLRPHEPRAERDAGTRSWLGDLSTGASGLGTLILTGHDAAKPRRRNAPEQHAASPQPRAENPNASNPVRGTLTRIMSYSARDRNGMDRDGNVRLISPFDTARDLSRDTSEPPRFVPAGTIQRVAAAESSPRPSPAPPLQSAPTIADQIPLLEQLGGWWRSRAPRGERDGR